MIFAIFGPKPRELLSLNPIPTKHDLACFTPSALDRYNLRDRRLRTKTEPPKWSWWRVPSNSLVVDIHNKLGFLLPKLEAGQIFNFCFTYFHQFFYHTLIFMDRGWYHQTDFLMLFPIPLKNWESVDNFFFYEFLKWG